MTNIDRRSRAQKPATVSLDDPGTFIRDHRLKDLVRDPGSIAYQTIQVPDRLGAAARPRGPAHSVAKRAFDIIVALFGILVLLPSLFAIALAIKLTSRGPVLFCQRRYGLNSETFLLYKFRTMYFDKCDDSGVTQTRQGDLRVTRVGRVLRRSNLDELPQLFNVLKGEMSLVGPRPHVPGMLAAGVPYEVFVPNYFDRHRGARPGVTGLAQARGFRGSTERAEDAKGRIDLDLKYIQNWSFGLDLRLILETAWTEFVKAGNGI